MRAVLQNETGDESTLFIGDAVIPEPNETEILIKVYATALNQMDLLQCKGVMPAADGASKILGMEAAGTVTKIGGKCSSKFKVGDRCVALLNGGGYAEYAVADERMVMLAPSNLSMTQLVAVPEEWMTAYQLLFSVARVQPGETVLVHFGASGIGQAAIQLAARHGCKVFATVFGDAKADFCRSMGAAQAFNIAEKTDNFAETVLAAVNSDGGGNSISGGVDIILDPIGGSYAAQNLACAGRDCRWVVHGLIGGAGVEDPSFLGKLMAKRICLLATSLRDRGADYLQKLAKSVEAEVLPAAACGELKINIDSVHPLTTEGTRAAHQRLASYMSVGKVVLTVAEEAAAVEAGDYDTNKRHKT